MTLIQIKDLTFSYPKNSEYVFENISFSFDTAHKSALIGRNGKGKTTLLKILSKQLDYKGEIVQSEECCYFPYEINNKQDDTIDVCFSIEPMIEQWKIERELNMLDVGLNVLYRPFSTLSMGEQTKVMLAILFLKENSFLLIDEPTNHLDQEGRQTVAQYLQKQSGFLLVSHDRYFVDQCCDHVIAILSSSIECMRGNFSSWYNYKLRKDQSEIEENKRLKKDIQRLEKSKKQKESWSNEIEKSKIGAADKGYVGHQAAKMMKRSKNIEKKQEKTIKKKQLLLKDSDEYEELSLESLDYYQTLAYFSHVSGRYDGEYLFKDLSFDIKSGERILVKGKNGSGKTSLLRFIMGDHSLKIEGDYSVASNLKISYLFQDYSSLTEPISFYIEEQDLDQTLVYTILRKMNFSRIELEHRLEYLSDGQKKKVGLALSLAFKAHLYIWDEPLNYIDVFTRIQIEELILKSKFTLLFVEHDVVFQKRLVTKIVEL